MSLCIDSPAVRGALWDARFGLEREALRVDAAGRMARTPHPYPADHPHVVRDFCENQTEINTGVADSPAAAVAEWVEGKFTIPTPTSTNTLLYSYDAGSKYIYVCGMALLEPYTYLAQFSEMANTKINYTERTVTTYYEGRFYTISFNVEESGALLLSLSLSEGREPQISISVNGGTAQPFWPDEGRYTLTVTLALGDTFTLQNAGEIGNPKAFEYNSGTQTYTVITAGTYTFTGDPGMIQVIRN